MSGPPPRSGHGCLWGCLAAAAIAAFAIFGGFGYLGWYLNAGFKNDATLAKVVVALNASPAARAELGQNIEVTSVSSSNFMSTLATGTTASYVAQVKGSRGEGTLEATVVPHGGASRITVLVLTGPDGARHDLNANEQIPSNSI